MNLAKWTGILLLLGILLLPVKLSAQTPPNDDCANATQVQFGQDNFSRGNFTSDTAQLTNATRQTGEPFHADIVNAGINGKTVWYRFYLPVKRAVRIELKQLYNSIGTNDAGFTVFKSDTCLPALSSVERANITPINQFGSSFHPCVEKGWYLVQVSGKNNVLGTIFLDFTVSFPFEHNGVTNANFDTAGLAYNFGIAAKSTKWVSYEVGCHTIDDTLERCQNLGNDYIQSSWHTFRTGPFLDFLGIRIGPAAQDGSTLFKIPAGTVIGYRLYKGNVQNSNYRNLPIIDTCGTFTFTAETSFPNSVEKGYRCLLDINQEYSIQLLFHKDFYNKIRVGVRSNSADGVVKSPVPVDSLMHPSSKLGVLPSSPNGITTRYQDYFSCKSTLADSANQCGSVNPAAGILEFNRTYGLATWLKFTLDEPANIEMTVGGECDDHYLARIFSDSITDDCDDIDASGSLVAKIRTIDTLRVRCFPAGTYSVQLLGVDSVTFDSCSSGAHFGRNVELNITLTSIPAMHRFSLSDTGRVDSINVLNGEHESLRNGVTYQSQPDSFGCGNTILPANSSCGGGNTTKAMYRVFKIGDMDGVGGADSAAIILEDVFPQVTGFSYRIFRGNAEDLAIQQQVFDYPDKLNGLTTVSNCLNDSNNLYCLYPGTYTLATFGGDNQVRTVDAPRIQARKQMLRHHKPELAEQLDTIDFTRLSSSVEWTCYVNPDTIQGLPPCFNFNKTIYREFYLPEDTIIAISNNGGLGVHRLFKGRATDGLNTLQLYQNIGGAWNCFESRSTNSCFPVEAGWYTLVTYGRGPSFEDTLQSGVRDYVGFNSQVQISILPPQPPSQYNRPHKAFFADGVLNNNFPLDYRSDTSSTPNRSRLFQLGTEFFTCVPDTPFSIHPINPCVNGFNRFAYYVFSIRYESYLKILNIDPTMKAAIYAFDVRNDSAKLLSEQPLQHCNRTPFHLEICRIQPGRYTLIIQANNLHDGANVTPLLQIDSVGTSRFDHASGAYDFGAVRGNRQWYGGRLGTQHPSNPNLAPSNDFFYCTTGAQSSDPPGKNQCAGIYNSQVYPDEKNNILFNDTNAFDAPIRRNLWYTFVLNGAGTAIVKVNSLTPGKSLLNSYFIYTSNVDASLPFDSVVARGLVDSTLGQGLTYLKDNYIDNDFGACQLTDTVSISRGNCTEEESKRYYILVDQNIGTLLNSQINVEIYYDSVPIPPLRYDHFSQANVINGLNQIDPPYNDTLALNTGVYFGGPGVFRGSTRDSNDQAPVCDFGTLWYKFRVDSSGVLRLRYRKNSTDTLGNPGILTLMREISPGDSTANGLQRLSTATDAVLEGPNAGMWLLACIEPGTYFVQTSGCDVECNDTITPIVWLDLGNGDRCNDPRVLAFNGPGTVKSSMTVDCHTMGGDFGEDGSNFSCLFGPTGFKSSWYRIDINDTGKFDVDFLMRENTTALPNQIRYRILYGGCDAMTSGPCNGSSLSQFSLNCLRAGNYFVQVVTPVGTIGNVELEVTLRRNIDDNCTPIDPDAPFADFEYSFGCAPDSVKFNNLSTQGAVMRYQWSFGDGSDGDTAIHPLHIFPASEVPTDYNVTLIVTNTRIDRADTITKVVTILPPPEQILGNDTTLCTGDTLILNAFFPDATYLWNTSETTASIVITGPGLYWVEILKEGCSRRDSIVVDYLPRPRLELVSDTAYCQRDSLILFGPPGMVSYLWSDNSTTDSLIITTPGQFTLLITDSLGCLNSDTVMVMENPLPSAAFAQPAPYCVNIPDFLLVPAGLSGGYFFGGNYVDSTGVFSPPVSGAGSFNVYYQVTDSNICSNTDSAIVLINPLPDASINAAGPFCIDAGIQQLSAAVNAGGIFYGGSFIDSLGNFNPAVAGAGNTKVYYTFTDSNTCVNADSTIIRVDPLPDASIDAAGPYCIDAGLQQMLPQVNFGGTFFGGAYIDSSGIFNPAIAGAGFSNIFYIFTDSNSCTNTGQISVRVDPLPDASISPAGPFCVDAGMQQLRAAVNTGGTFYGGNFVDGAGRFFPDVAGVGASKVFYTYTDSNSCVNIDSLSITVNALPDAGINPSGPFCVDAGPQQLSAKVNAGGTYFGGAFISSSGVFNPDIATPGLWTIFYTFTDANGCTGVDSTQIRVYPLPDASITSAGPFCIDAGPQQLRAAVNQGGSFFGGAYISTAGVFNPAVAGAGVSWVFYTFTDSNSCTKIDSTPVRVDPLPDARISPAGPFCIDAGLQPLTGAVNVGGTFFGGRYISSDGIFDPAIAGAGIHKVFYTFTDSNTCVNLDSISIRVNPLPDASIVQAGPFCANNTVQQMRGAVNVGGTFSGGPYISPSGGFDPRIALAGLHNIVYTFTDLNGCTNFDSTKIRVHPVPDASIVPAGPFCIDAGPQLITPQVNTAGTFSGGNFITSAGRFSPDVAGAGIARVFYQYTDSNACTQIDSLDIRVNPLPDAAVTPAGPFCLNDSLQQLVPATNAGGRFSGGPFVDSGGWFNPAIPGVRTVRVFYTFTDQNRCTNRDSIFITVNGLPNAGLRSAGPWCIDAGIQQLMAETPGGIFSGGDFVSASGQFNPAVAGEGRSRVFYTLSDNNNCRNSDSADFVVNGLPEVQLSTVNPLCKNNAPVQLMATPSGGSFSGGAFISPGGLFTPSMAGEGNFQIFYNFQDRNGCVNGDTTDITVHPLPDPDFLANPDRGCFPLEVQFFSWDGMASYSWRFSDGTTSTEQNPVKIYPNKGVFGASLSVTDTNGCNNFLTQTEIISVSDRPVADFDFSPTVPTVVSPLVQFRDLSLNRPVNWLWDFGDGNTDTRQNPAHEYSLSDTFQIWLYVSNGLGCRDSAMKMIWVGEGFEVYIPNSFSPNNDNLNDVFVISALGAKEIEMSIYSRWGEIIFYYKGNDSTVGWNGTYKGAPVQDGAYIYLLRLVDEFGQYHIREGVVTLLR